MMAQPVPHHSTDKKRVKVYELRNNDWFDRGTGFCTAALIPQSDEAGASGGREPRVVVESEDQPERLLLETRICREDGFQKQQDTLIVWTEPSNGIDMALSFQEAEGCAMIWKFISGIQQSFSTGIGPDDSLSDDIAIDIAPTVTLPPPELGNLAELENAVRVMSSTASGRDALAKGVMVEEYIKKLVSLVEMAEDLESLEDLHRLCSIVKVIILLNDTTIIEYAVSDDCVLGVVGALEYDPDFPSHKANHRQWLSNQGRYKEVVRIQDDQVRRKIHQTYRLQYLKDVVLARILDDPTFSVLNSLIFFNQVDIVQHLQANIGFLSDLFGIFSDPTEDIMRKKEAVVFIQNCCAISKNLQPPARLNLFSNFLQHGLLGVINFGLRNTDVAARTGATDILVAMIDHDPQMVRQTIYRQIQEKHQPLTDTLIDLLLVEVDLGIKSQISDALKVLLDPNPTGPLPDGFVPKAANGDFPPRPQQRPPPTVDAQQEVFLTHFYDHSVARLFKPLLELEGRTEMRFPVPNDGIFGYLNEILCFYVRNHHHRSKFFVLQHNIAQRFVQLLGCREKHLQLVAIRFFRQLVTLQDEFYIRHLIEKQVFGPIIDVVMRTLPRDNLLCSAIMDLFEHVKKDSARDLVKHILENYGDKIQELSYLEIFRELLMKGEQPQQVYANNIENFFMESDDDAARRPAGPVVRGGPLMEHLTMDPEEEAYWNTSDDEEENQTKAGPASRAPSTNGSSPLSKPLVDYPSDEETEENGDADMVPPAAGEDGEPKGAKADDDAVSNTSASPTRGPPERLSEKRRREEDDDDELSKLMHNKRRNSSSASMNSAATTLRRKKSMGREPRDSTGKKVPIAFMATARPDEEAG